MSDKAFIFDLDGVIVDTARFHYLAWKQLANDLGFDFTKEQNELLKGVSREKSLEILLDIGKIELPDSKKKSIMHEKNERYLEYVMKMDENDILPGIKDLLIYLKSINIPFSLGSASKNARPILERLELIDYFDAIVDGNDVTKAKPDPEVFLIAAKKLNKDASNCIVVEDAKAGVEAAINANMLSIGIGDKKNLNKADFVLENTNELSIEFIQKLIA